VFYALMEAFRNDIFINEYNTSYSKMTCAMFRYVLSEQVNVDWLQKSSTIEPINISGSNLIRTNTLHRDDVVVISDFYSSVKSYRDKIRSSSITKQLIEINGISFDELLSVDDTEIAIGIGGDEAGDTIVFN
jgi:AICAR transformylase/IMP cyclohydrolase PurH